MNKMVFGLLAGLVLGGIAGAMVSQQAMRRHQQGLAVMWLMQRHLDDAMRAISGNAAPVPQRCDAARMAAQRVSVMGDELVGVFPLAYQQDELFHRYVEQLRTAATGVQQSRCSALPRMVQDLRAACDQCHRDYR